jgi:hypothetical protein
MEGHRRRNCTVSHFTRNETIVKWLWLLFRIRNVPGSNLSPETGYPDYVSDVPKSLQKNAGIVP